MAFLDVLHGRQLPVIVALWRRLIHRRCLFSLFPTETSEHCSVLTEDGWQLVIRWLVNLRKVYLVLALAPPPCGVDVVYKTAALA